MHDGLGLVIKQIELIPNTAPITLRIFSENTADSAYDRSIEEVHIIGQMVWFARAVYLLARARHIDLRGKPTDD